jgi:hypothetical protein
MPSEVANKEDLHDVRDMVLERVDTGFSAITARLDVLNGRVGKGEVANAVTDQRLGHMDQRIGNVEKDLFNRRSTDQPAGKPEPDDQAAITKRDLKVAVWVISTMYVLAQVAFKVVPFLSKLAQP